MPAADVAFLRELITALQAAMLAIVRGEFSEVDAVEQRFKTHDPAKLQDMLDKAKQQLRRELGTGGRGGLVLRQGK
jgi:hypothetical protein